ncbi:hypothetical protein COOONC_18664 [Cooperia oncophora]
MITIITTLVLATLAAPPSEVASKSKCEYFLQRIPGMNPLVLTDANGKKCRGVVEIPVCRGYCIPLTDCDEGADDSIKSVSIPTGEKCGCKKFPFN